MTDHARLLTALTKAGATVTEDGTRFHAAKGARRILWFTQESMMKPGRLEAVCVHSPSPLTDASTDCFCDTYHDTIKAAVAALA